MADNSAGEKTEKPTPRRLQKSREEGKVAKSQELNSAFTLMGSFLLLYILFKNIISNMEERMIYFLSFDTIPAISIDNSVSMVLDIFLNIVKMVGPVMLASAVMGVVISFIQVGAMFSTKSIQPKLSNINPLSGMKRLVSLKSLIELAKSMAKAGVIAYLAYGEIKKHWSELITMTGGGVDPSLLLIGNLIFRIAIKIIIFLVLLGVLDYIYQRWEYMKNLKMSKHEVKQERKEYEGDPLIKSKRKEKQRELSLNRMMTAMKDADVVITNPTHIAVALKYKIDEMEAPLLIAKGEGFIAQKIKERAKELGIEIIENKPLARSLNKTTEIGEKIPIDLYQAVAEILAFIYQKKH